MGLQVAVEGQQALPGAGMPQMSDKGHNRGYKMLKYAKLCRGTMGMHVPNGSNADMGTTLPAHALQHSVAKLQALVTAIATSVQNAMSEQRSSCIHMNNEPVPKTHKGTWLSPSHERMLHSQERPQTRCWCAWTPTGCAPRHTHIPLAHR